MCDELRDALGEHVDDFVIEQLKEKYNELRLYWCWGDKDYTDEEAEELNRLCGIIESIIDKYTTISYNTCMFCGAPATKWSRAYAASYYDKCYDEFFLLK